MLQLFYAPHLELCNTISKLTSCACSTVWVQTQLQEQAQLPELLCFHLAGVCTCCTDHCLAGAKPGITVHKLLGTLLATTKHSHQKTNIWDYKLPFASQHGALPLLQMTTVCSQSPTLFAICQQEQQLFGRLHKGQNSWEQHSSQRHQSRQLQQLPELLDTKLLYSLLPSVSIFFSCI